MTTGRPRPRSRRSRLAVLGLGAILVTACTQAVPSGSPPASATATTTVAPSPTASPTPAPTASPPPTPVPTPTPTPVPTPCPVVVQEGTLPSDRLIDVETSSGAGADRFIFHFGNPSIGSPAGIPGGELRLAEPPYTYGPSGLPIEMTGERVIQIVFRRMSLQADTGEPTYQGPPEVRPDLGSLKHAVEFDQSEGVIGWYIGFDGPACVTLTRDGRDVIVSFQHL